MENRSEQLAASFSREGHGMYCAGDYLERSEYLRDGALSPLCNQRITHNTNGRGERSKIAGIEVDGYVVGSADGYVGSAAARKGCDG